MLKGTLICCSLPLGLCRGQAYGSAANMQGKHKGLNTMILRENPAALPGYCYANCINLCLQELEGNIPVRDTLDNVREVLKLIVFFSEKISPFST